MILVKRARFIFPLILFLVIITFLWRGLSLHPNVVPSPLINKPVPDFTLPTLFDKSENTTNDDFIGRVSLVNVWATWCYTCAQEHDLLLQLANTKDVMIYGLNYKDDTDAAKKWLEEHGNPYQIVAFDEKGQTAIDWGVYGTPETFVIDKKGVVRYKHVGPLTTEVWEKNLEPLVTQLRNETL